MRRIDIIHTVEVPTESTTGNQTKNVDKHQNYEKGIHAHSPR